ncbi:MAG: MipA/OmpV family protein [Bdellovibrionaceae bacterium]|nr:MipA/OmpV family protein [Pseudobdellovibrionaceae bacterium]
MKFFLLIWLQFASQCWANDQLEIVPKALYEFGAGAGFFETPYYQGSKQLQRRTIGLPYFIYRGKILKSDREGGTRAEFIKLKNFRLDLSFSGNFSASSSEIAARQGMPDLAWMGAVGPRAVWRLYNSAKYGKVRFHLPLRAAFVTDFKRTGDQGFLFHPNFTYNIDKVFFHWLDFYFRGGTIFADDRYMEYYYEVSPKFVSSTRKLYQAQAGLLETHFDMAAALRLNPRWRLFFGLEYSCFDGVANSNSPLLTARDTASLAVGVVWTLFESEARSGKWY